MKKLLLSIVVLFVIKTGNTQNIGGIWEGVFYAPRNKLIYKYYFYLEIKQKGRTIWGVYTTMDSTNMESYTCLTSVSGTLPKKPSAVFDLYKERVEDFDKKNTRYELCNFVNRLSFHYFMQDSVEYLTGKWFPESGGGPTSDGAGGLFILHHLNYQTFRNVDAYFPKLEKMIAKGKGNAEVVLTSADDVSAANPTEKKLIDVIKPFIRKRLP